MKLVFNAGSYKIILPKRIVEDVLKWKHGEELKLSVGLNEVCITKKES